MSIMNLDYVIAKVISRLSKNRHEKMSAFFRKAGIKVGERCNITCDIRTSESYLISIGNDVTVSIDVLFLTHDASVGKIFGKENGSDLLGRISIGNNCFIGARSTILPGITLANNIIVASCSVVTKSFTQENIIIGGNPARIIGTWDQLKEKTENKVYKLHGKKGSVARRVVESDLQRLIVK